MLGQQGVPARRLPAPSPRAGPYRPRTTPMRGGSWGRCPQLHHDVIQIIEAWQAGRRVRGHREAAGWFNRQMSRTVSAARRGRCIDATLYGGSLEAVYGFAKREFGLSFSGGRGGVARPRAQEAVPGRRRRRAVPMQGFGNVPVITHWPVRTITPQQYGPDFTQQPDPVGFPHASNVDGFGTIGNYVMDSDY